MQIGAIHIDTKAILSTWQQEFKSNGIDVVSIAHLGPINQDLVNSLSESVESLMVSAGDKKPVIKRVFSILIEGLQNILLHGESFNDEQLSLLLVGYNETHYKVVLGNIALASDEEKLKGYLDGLNNKSEEEVKAFYLETLNNGLISDKGGAGLGFITMRMKSKAQLVYQFKPWTETERFFSIETEIEK